jgi:hypothetical protein
MVYGLAEAKIKLCEEKMSEAAICILRTGGV